MAGWPADSRIAELEQQVEQLRAALVSNRVTATAVGLLMARYRMDRGRAFACLVAEAQATNTKVSAVALALVTRAEDAAHRLSADLHDRQDSDRA